MTYSKRAETAFPIQEQLQSRYSPYAFEERAVSIADLRSIFEAARWAPSSFNEQPWRYVVAPRSNADEFARLLSCLTDSNQLWAKSAAVLGLAITRIVFSLNGKPNRMAYHDLGLATASLIFEAMSRGVHVHPMGGILPDRARELYEVPPEFEAVTGLALGYPVPHELIPAEWQKKELAGRSRRKQSETVFARRWGGYGLADPS